VDLQALHAEVEYCSEYYKNPIYNHLHEAMRAHFQELLVSLSASPSDYGDHEEPAIDFPMETRGNMGAIHPMSFPYQKTHVAVPGSRPWLCATLMCGASLSRSGAETKGHPDVIPTPS